MKNNSNEKENDAPFSAADDGAEKVTENVEASQKSYAEKSSENAAAGQEKVTEGGEEVAATDAATLDGGAIATNAPVPTNEEKPTGKQQFLQILKFTAFSASAGVIQLLSTTLLHQWTGWLAGYYWIAYVIGLALSVVWNFTFNRKFTFKASNNVPVAMVLVLIYNLLIVVPLAYGGDELVKLLGDVYGVAVTACAMLINFVTEFLWDKFVVFNDKITEKISKMFKRKK